MLLTLRVRRANLLDEASNQLAVQEPLSVTKRLQAVFEGESAVDVGRSGRESLYLVSEHLFPSDPGMLVIANERFN